MSVLFNSDSDIDKPRWWEENQQLKRKLDLPPYEPSRFNDGTYTYKLVEELEDEYGCHIQFIGVNPRYPDSWYVKIDGKYVFSIGRSRDNNGNTIYNIKPDKFEKKIAEHMGDK